MPDVNDNTTHDIQIRELTTVDDIFVASQVLGEVWKGDRDALPTNLMRALQQTGNYVVGLYDGDSMIGASIAFFGPPASRSMHSHITGVLAEYQGQGPGRILKQHQRAWAFARDVGHITWTFDPLVARNAYFNLAVLGAKVSSYLVDNYGAMDDGLNRGDKTDRLMVSWALAGSPASAPTEVAATVAVPEDIAVIRENDRTEALKWRMLVREQLLAHLENGLLIAGFDERGYLLVRP